MARLDLLRPYQSKAAKELARREKVGLWCAAGTGKTATILAAYAMVGAPKPYLVVTRALGRGVWPRDARWLLGEYYSPAILLGNSVKGDGYHGNGSYSCLEQALLAHIGVVISYDVLRGRIGELSRIPWKVMILDEAHLVKGGHLPLQLNRQGKPHYTRFHFAQRLSRDVHYRGGLVLEATATPIKDRPRDLWGQLDLVLPGQFGTAWSFLKRYCDSHYGEYGLVTTGLSNADELRERLAKHFVKVTREEIADQLPSLTRSIVEIEKDEGAVEKWGGGVENSIAMAAQMKFTSAVELAADYLNTRGKVVCVVNRRRLVPQLYQRFEKLRKKVLTRDTNSTVNVIAVSGEMEAMKRAAELDAFNEGPSPAICFATIDCLSESINLHKCDACFVLSLPYTHGLLDQLEGRFARLGGISSEIQYLIVRDTIDERIRELLLDKQEKIVNVSAGTTNVAAAHEDFAMTARDSEVLAELRDWLNKGEE